MGDLNAQRIRKKPQEAFIREIESAKQSDEPMYEVIAFHLSRNLNLIPLVYFKGNRAF